MVRLLTRNLTHRYPHRTLFAGLNEDVRFSRILLVKGRVGSGKTTLLKMLAGVSRPQDGSAELLTDAGSPCAPIYLHANPEFNFVTGYVRDEFLFAGITPDDTARSADSSMGQTVFELSGGEMKKLSLELAMRYPADVILADEPLEMLDDDERERLALLVIAESARRPFIIATHDDRFDAHADAVITI